MVFSIAQILGLLMFCAGLFLVFGLGITLIVAGLIVTGVFVGFELKEAQSARTSSHS